jgi:hypothetical protein
MTDPSKKLHAVFYPHATSPPPSSVRSEAVPNRRTSARECPHRWDSDGACFYCDAVHPASRSSAEGVKL